MHYSPATLAFIFIFLKTQSWISDDLLTKNIVYYSWPNIINSDKIKKMLK